MTKELQKEFYEKYPVLFQDADKSKLESCMHWGIAFGNGWATIFDQLCEYLTKLSGQSFSLKAKASQSEPKFITSSYPQVKFEQVKEKFGTMCVYWSVLPHDGYAALRGKLEEPEELTRKLIRFNDRVSDAVSYAEFLSSKTCETSGDPGKLIHGDWLKVRCDKCLEQEEKHEQARNRS